MWWFYNVVLRLYCKKYNLNYNIVKKDIKQTAKKLGKPIIVKDKIKYES